MGSVTAEEADSCPDQVARPISDEDFMRLFLSAERELLRYVIVLIPNVSDARDVLQQTAIALWKAIDKYDPSRPFVPWARGFALNAARTFLRANTRRNRLKDEDVMNLLENRRVEMSSRLDSRREHLADCLSRLPDEQLELVRGYYFEEEQVETLARRFSRGKEAVYKSLQRIRQALHECIERKLRTES